MTTLPQTLNLDTLLGLTRAPAALILADGSRFDGYSIGAAGISVGEVVFNTALTGYQEILTDPSYTKQIVTLTYPHIGNVGTNPQDAESTGVFCAGLIVGAASGVVSNFRNEQDLSSYLNAHGLLGITGIDTRALTRLLREKGAQNGVMIAGDVSADKLSQAQSQLAEFKGLAGLDLAKVVSVKTAYNWTQGEWALNHAAGGSAFNQPASQPYKVVAFDYGVKHNILRMLAERGCDITVVPAQTSAAEVLALKPDGVFLSNGPGDPEPCDYAINAINAIVEKGVPTFGICLGHQLLALASGAKTLKMKFGHHGANHPVKDLDSGKVAITSQNHGFAVNENSLPANLRVTHVSLFDGSIQGIARTDKPAFSFQGHPEASPGPHDIGYLFDQFVALMGKK